MVSLNALAKEVEKMLKKLGKRNYHLAVREVLRMNGIKENWDYYFSAIGREMRRKRYGKLQRKHEKEMLEFAKLKIAIAGSFGAARQRNDYGDLIPPDF